MRNATEVRHGGGRDGGGGGVGTAGSMEVLWTADAAATLSTTTQIMGRFIAITHQYLQ